MHVLEEISTDQYFNSQPHKEADAFSSFSAVWILYFNSQPHKEADAFSSFSAFWILYFNSQPHKEADQN